MESIGYMLVYLLRGSLPWQGQKGNTKKMKYDKILERKMATTTDMLCKNLPSKSPIIILFIHIYQLLALLNSRIQSIFSTC